MSIAKYRAGLISSFLLGQEADAPKGHVDRRKSKAAQSKDTEEDVGGDDILNGAAKLATPSIADAVAGKGKKKQKKNGPKKSIDSDSASPPSSKKGGGGGGSGDGTATAPSAAMKADSEDAAESGSSVPGPSLAAGDGGLSKLFSASNLKKFKRKERADKAADALEVRKVSTAEGECVPELRWVNLRTEGTLLFLALSQIIPARHHMSKSTKTVLNTH